MRPRLRASGRLKTQFRRSQKAKPPFQTASNAARPRLRYNSHFKS
ncbi:hypothetical protein HMPREF9123_0639 [Neisseria bacilliformis ATCC BAA-1200]|uniref:Uncharacterized protein n=1 Tax=Neisseria bacilliformis ATCC BAA-1200 TaxID=888742 RepID=F2BAG7_9NEIS|nr:hypothetical protein HMPREF9123_0639 [Neisseria bacilliformis ATCC BAA-1200]